MNHSQKRTLRKYAIISGICGAVNLCIILISVTPINETAFDKSILWIALLFALCLPDCIPRMYHLIDRQGKPQWSYIVTQFVTVFLVSIVEIVLLFHWEIWTSALILGIITLIEIFALIICFLYDKKHWHF